MGYDVVVLNESESRRLDSGELLPMELDVLTALARAHRLPILSSLPDYWGGDELDVRGEGLPALVDELARVVRLTPTPPWTESAAKKLQRLVNVAIEEGAKLTFVPD